MLIPHHHEEWDKNYQVCYTNVGWHKLPIKMPIQLSYWKNLVIQYVSGISLMNATFIKPFYLSNLFWKQKIMLA